MKDVVAVVEIQESQVAVIDYQDFPAEASAVCKQFNSESSVKV